MTDKDLKRARSQAKAQFDSIREMVDNLRNAPWEAAAQAAGWEPFNDQFGAQCWRDKADNQTWAGTAKDLCEEFGLEQNDTQREEAEQTIHEDALSVEVRTDWHTPGSHTAEDACTPTEYRILLCTGGPAVQITGDLSGHCEPETATIQYQDWFTPWTEWRGEDVPEDAEEILLEYARCFWFGE